MNDGLRLLRDSAPRPRRLLRVAGWAGVECLPALLSGLAVAHATDAFTREEPLRAATWLVALALSVLIGAWATHRVYAALAPLVEDLRDTLMTAASRGTIHRCATTGRPGRSTVTNVIEQVDQVRNLVSALLRSLRSTVAPLVAAVIGLLVLDRLLAVAVIVPLLLILAAQACLVPRTIRRTRASTQRQEVLGADATTALGALDGLRGIGAVGWARDLLSGDAGTVAQADIAVIRVVSARRALIALGTHVPLLTVLLASIPLVRDGRVSAGTVLGATTYVFTSLGPALSSLVGAAGAWLVELSVLLDRLALVSGHPEPSLRPKRRPPGPGIDLETRGLCFGYRADSPPIIDDLAARVTRGEHVAVVGASGTGKSTLAHLLAGIDTPTAGQVTLARQVCFVPQESYIFAGTLRDNLVYLAPGPVETVDLVAAEHGLDDLVGRIGLDGPIDPASETLTPADRQRIVLARAWLSGAGIVVLDEATSRLGSSEERALEELYRHAGRTLLTIAHHLDVAARADQVIYLDGAHIRVGTHEGLLRGSPAYARLQAYAKAR